MGVLSLQKAREERTPHISGNAQCIGCQHKWVAVAPVGTSQMDCPECGANKGVFVNPCYVGEQVWMCNCGNDLFRISPSWGPYCANCASPAEGWFK